MKVGLEGILHRLAERDLILPYFDAALLSEKWPEKYSIEIDSSPYYGLDADGSPDGYFHPSTHSMLPERELYYRFHPDTRDKMAYERRTVQNLMTLTMGSAWHGIIQTQLEMMKLVRGPQDVEVEYINKEHHVRGRIDWITHLPNGMVLPAEMKTRNSWKFRSKTEAEPDELAQLNLGLDALDMDLGVLFVLEAGFPWRMTEFQVRRDRDLLDNLYAKFDRVRAAIAANEPPRHCCAPDSTMMKACPARHVCWLKGAR